MFNREQRRKMKNFSQDEIEEIKIQERQERIKKLIDPVDSILLDGFNKMNEMVESKGSREEVEKRLHCFMPEFYVLFSWYKARKEQLDSLVYFFESLEKNQ